MIIFLIILILFVLGIYYIYKEGYLPMTKPHLEKSKIKVDNIINEIGNKFLDPDTELRNDVNFLKQKINKFRALILLNSKVKDYIINERYDDLSWNISKLLNHHAADLDISSICDNTLNRREIRTRFPGYASVLDNLFDINSFFNPNNELFNSCYHLTSNELENEQEESCYRQIKADHRAINICSIETLNEFLNPRRLIVMPILLMS